MTTTERPKTGCTRIEDVHEAHLAVGHAREAEGVTIPTEHAYLVEMQNHKGQWESIDGPDLLLSDSHDAVALYEKMDMRNGKRAKYRIRKIQLCEVVWESTGR